MGALSIDHRDDQPPEVRRVPVCAGLLAAIAVVDVLATILSLLAA